METRGRRMRPGHLRIALALHAAAVMRCALARSDLSELQSGHAGAGVDPAGWWSVLLPTLGVIGLIVLLSALVRRWSPGRAGGGAEQTPWLRELARHELPSGTVVTLLRVGGRVLVIGETPGSGPRGISAQARGGAGSVVTLAEFAAGEEAEALEGVIAAGEGHPPKPAGQVIAKDRAGRTAARMGKAGARVAGVVLAVCGALMMTREASAQVMIDAGVNAVEVERAAVRGDADLTMAQVARSVQGMVGAASDAGRPAGGLAPAGLVLLGVSLVPVLMLMCSCYLRVLVVLQFLRTGLGAGAIPPPQVVTILAVFATLAAMGPTIDRINAEAVSPYRAGVHADAGRLWLDAERPVRDFMFAQMDATGGGESLAVMMGARGVSREDLAALPRSRVPITALIPAFMLSELKAAFVMGLKILLPFLVIDLVVGAVLMSMGMVMLPPAVVALPFKVLLFVAVDGWTLVVGSLVRSVAEPAAGPALTMIGGGG